jgi:hypothetical protein
LTSDVDLVAEEIWLAQRHVFTEFFNIFGVGIGSLSASPPPSTCFFTDCLSCSVWHDSPLAIQVILQRRRIHINYFHVLGNH